MLPNRNDIFFDFGSVTSKLAHIVLINDRNNMCKGISQNLKIEHKRKNVKYHKSQVLPIRNGAYPTSTAKNEIAVFFSIRNKLTKDDLLQQYYIDIIFIV